MPTKTLVVQKDLNVRIGDPGGDEQNGQDQHLRIGQRPSNYYQAFININQDWTEVGRITSAVLRLTMSNAHGGWGSSPRILIKRATEQWVEGAQGENVWASWAQNNYGVTTTGQKDKSFAFALNGVIEIDLTYFFGLWAPATVMRKDGTPGKGVADYGFMVRAYDQNAVNDGCEFYSKQHANAAFRPQVILTYDLAPVAPDVPSGIAPVGTTAKVPNVTGAFIDRNPGDKLKATEVTLYDVTGVNQLWKQTVTATPSEVAASAFSVPLPALVLLETTYAYKVRVQDSTGRWSGLTTLTYFTFTNNPPLLTLVPLGSYPSLAAVLFSGVYSDANQHPMGALRIQLRPTTAPGDPLWDGNTNLWDTSDVAPTAAEVAAKQFARPYGGQPLTPATYSWRARVQDQFGAISSWVYATVTLSAPFSPDPGTINNITGYQKKARTRVVLRKMTTGRGPLNPPVAIIEDAANVGASAYLNSPGEFYMTLPATHPQVSVCEPFQTHYAVEVWNNDRWRETYAGILVDFDAGEDDVVIYGMDYLGLLDLLVDERYDKTNPDKDWAAGGSKYTDQTLTTVITNQLNHARGKTDSPVGFIGMGQMDVFPEKVSIFSTFKQVGPFVQGLIRSHRQGTGKRSRLQVRKTAAGTGYEFVLLDNAEPPSKNRDNIRLEYGGLVQGFRLVAMGDFATFFYAIGRTMKEVTPFYSSAAAPGVPPATWGRIERAAVYTDIFDENDLTRRTKQAAAEGGRVGKRIALGLRTDALLPFDGYDIGDHLPVRIQRGVVDTTRYGAGYWTLMGIEWRVFPDGHSETTLVTLPKEDGSTPDPDLIPSLPVDEGGGLGGQEWEIGYVPPVEGTNVGKLYLDLTTGITYELQPDGTYLPADHPPVITPPDGLALTTNMDLNEAGLPIVKLTATITPDPGWGTEYRTTWVEITSDNDGANPPNPDWTNSTLLQIPYPETTASLEGVTGGIQYWARTWAVDFVGVPSTITAHQVITTATDTQAPGQPQGFTIEAAVEGFFAAWEKTIAQDLDYYEMRFAEDSGSGTGVGATPSWNIARMKTNFAFVGALVPNQKYWVQLRAVDTSGNVEDASVIPSVTVKANTNDDIGYTTLVPVTPVLVGSALLDEGIITDDHIIPGGLSAAVLKTGLLKVSLSDVTLMDGIQVISAGKQVGLWNETGLYIYEANNPGNYVRVFEAGITVFRNNVPTTAITPDGINATAIVLGALPGGNNIIPNSSFELVNFSSVATIDIVWTASADWTATRVGSDVNVTTGANDLSQTGATY